MRCTPMAIFGLFNDNFYEESKQECGLTHSNDLVKDVVYVYEKTCTFLLKLDSSDYDLAIEHAKNIGVDN